MSDAREFTADLLSGARNHIDDNAPRGTRSTRGSTEDVLQQTREALDKLEALRKQDRAEALRVFRSLLVNDTLTDEHFDQFLEVYRTAIDDPQTFRDKLQRSPDEPRGPVDWWNALRAYVHRPVRPSAHEREVLQNLARIYRFPTQGPAPEVNPHERIFETFDPAWVPLANVKLNERNWPDGLLEMPRHTGARPFVYEALGANKQPLAAGAAHQIALLSDFGTGCYQSWGIAAQLSAWALPYTFHLGDVYYGGYEEEFRDRFELPLFDVVEKTRFMGIPENHELYAGGAPYLEYIAKLSRRTHQEGSYFCVRFPHHQVIAIDVNWQGRQRYTDEELRGWLRDRLADSGGRTNILLSGSAPFDHGSTEARPLLTDLWEFVGGGAIALWFWGDDHYAALFDRREPQVPFYGSCIGHGGYPGPKQTAWKPTYHTSPLWVEDLARFPAWTQMRQDMTNNGWCHATLRADGGVDLLYVDWLWCKRMAISFAKDGTRLVAGQPTFFNRDSAPDIHKPA